MTDLTLDEELFLITRDPGTGRDLSSVGIDAPLAGAVLIGLADAGAIEIVDGRVRARKAARMPRPHLQAALDLIASIARDRKPGHWVGRLPRTLGLQEQVGLSLVERGILRDERSRFLGITIKRFPQADPSPVEEIRRRVVAALTGADPMPAPRTRLLAGLLGPADMVKKLVERPDRRDARRRAKDFLAEAPVGGAVSDAVAAAQQAVYAAILVSVVASSSGGDGGSGGGGDGGGGGGGV